jgi:predicted RNase H-like nuclease (RuvC/YqgF family)
LEEGQQRLKEGQQRLDARTSRLEKGQQRLEGGQQRLDARTSRLETDMSEVKKDLAELKGNFHEMSYRDKAASIFGRYVRRGRDMTNEIADQLHEAQEAGQITAQAFAKVLAADLLWGGHLRQAKGKVILVIEASWQAEVRDVERAINRTEILHTIGLRALPVVAGRQWTDEAAETARERGVVTTTNGYVDENSWEKALSAHSAT